MWRDLHVVCFGKRRYLSHLGYSARVREIGLRHADTGIEGLQEFVSTVQTLPHCDGNTCLLHDISDAVLVLRQDWFFRKKRMELFHNL